MNGFALYWNTYNILIFGCLLVIIFIGIMIYQKRPHEIELIELSRVFFASSSIGGGLKLIYSTIAILNDSLIESDKLYTIYGGFCVVWISVNSLKKKINQYADKKENR